VEGKLNSRDFKRFVKRRQIGICVEPAAKVDSTFLRRNTYVFPSPPASGCQLGIPECKNSSGHIHSSKSFLIFILFFFKSYNIFFKIVQMLDDIVSGGSIENIFLSTRFFHSLNNSVTDCFDCLSAKILRTLEQVKYKFERKNILKEYGSPLLHHTTLLANINTNSKHSERFLRSLTV